MRTTISIFIPTYNSSLYILETVNSLLCQTYRNIEIVCVDDGSIDNTVEILRSCAEKDHRVKVIVKDNEGCVPFSWNCAFPFLSGDFTLYMSHDDLLEPFAIKKLLTKQQSEPEIDCVIPSLIFFEKEMKQPESFFSKKNLFNDMSNHPTVSGLRAFEEMLDYSIPGFGLWRTELIKRIGMPTESFNSDECMQRIWAKNCRKVAFSDAKFGYRQSSKSIVKGLKPYHLFSIATNLRLFKELVGIDCIDIERKKKMQYKWFESLFYLDSQYKKMKDTMTTEQQLRYESISKESYDYLCKDIRCPKTLKGMVMKLASINILLYSIIVKLK